VKTGEPPARRTTVAWAVGIGLVLLALVALSCAIFYAWIEAAAPGNAPLNHAMSVISKVAVPACIAGAIVIPRLIRRRRS
jgi:hypothetical protein